MALSKILFSGFYDGPLAFVTNHENRQYLFWRGFFDEELDDFPSDYQVFVLPNLSDEVIKQSWALLPERTVSYVGRVHLNQVIFDPTKKLAIDIVTFDRITK